MPGPFVASRQRSDHVVSSAVAATETVARQARISIGPIADASGAHAAAALFAEIWAPTRPEATLSADVIRALAYSGNYVAGAWAGPALVGASVAFVALAAESLILHSHGTGVARHARGTKVGLALKLHQRAWALERGIQHIEWTFDPLVRRNACFNLMKLGAVAVAYHPDFYGPMPDGINAGDESDRCLVRWDLCNPDVVLAVEREEPAPGAGRPLEGIVLLDEDRHGDPVVATAFTPPAEGACLCRIPADIEADRRAHPGRARAWRLALRDTMGAAMAAGFTARTISRDGCYLLNPCGAERRGA
jgi:predicted GNAT superfamily acetyltransferase